MNIDANEWLFASLNEDSSESQRCSELELLTSRFEFVVDHDRSAFLRMPIGVKGLP
jgi:hypothetical protein